MFGRKEETNLKVWIWRKVLIFLNKCVWILFCYNLGISKPKLRYLELLRE